MARQIRKKTSGKSKTGRTRASARKRPVAAEDIYDFEMVVDAALSPDEKRIAYTVESVDAKHRKYYKHIHVHDLGAGFCRQFTFGEISDRSLRWSPNGKSIAFISTRDKKTALYLISAEGGSERKLLEMDGSFGALQWFPDGKRLLFSFRKNDSFDIKDEKEKKEAPLFRHITRYSFRLDGTGLIPRDPTHVWSMDIKTGSAFQLTRGRLEHEAITLSPDGKKIYFISCDRKDPDRYSSYADVFVMASKGGKASQGGQPSQGGKPRKLRTPEGPKYALALSPDGKKLAYLGHDNPHDAWSATNTHIWVMPTSGAGSPKNVIKKFDRNAVDETIGDTGDVDFSGAIQFSKDGRRIFFLASDTGNTHLFYAPARGGAPTRITKKAMHIKSFSVSGSCKTAALVMSDLKTLPELYTVPTVYNADKRMKRITGVSETLARKWNLGKTKEVWFKSFDGFDLQGWMALPPNFNPRRKYPAIVEVHGGPRVQYGNSFFHEMRYLAAQGYVVMYSNPRGGNGRGETFAEAIVGGWGDLDYKDVMAAADYLESRPFVNSKRMGITGGSYGGFMTNWVIGHTNRFRAAVTQRSVVDLSSFVGSSDIGYDLYKEFNGQPWENPENYRECSPITHIGKHVRTPLLIIHSEKDLRCHIEQGEQLFVKMKWLGKKVEMVRFPEEPHGLSRHGRPDRRVARLEWIKKWFDKYLK